MKNLQPWHNWKRMKDKCVINSEIFILLRKISNRWALLTDMEQQIIKNDYFHHFSYYDNPITLKQILKKINKLLKVRWAQERQQFIQNLKTA